MNILDMLIQCFTDIFGYMATIDFGSSSISSILDAYSQSCETGFEFLLRCMFDPYTCFPILCLLGMAFGLFYLIFILPMDCFKRVIRAPKLGGGKRK